MVSSFLPPVCFHEMISNFSCGFFLQLAHNNRDLVWRGMEIYFHAMIRLHRLLAYKDKEIQDLKDNLEELRSSQEETAARGFDFKLRCEVLGKDKAEHLEKSIHKGKTIKKLRESLKHDVSSYQKSADFTEVKVHIFKEGLWHEEAKSRARYPDYALDYDSFALSYVVVETMRRSQTQDA